MAVPPQIGGSHSVRVVRFQDGKLKEVKGKLIKRRKQVSPGQREWTRCLYAGANRKMTVGQAAGLFHQRTGKWPTGDLKTAPRRGTAQTGLASAARFTRGCSRDTRRSR
jgi:hypothetical protein